MTVNGLKTMAKMCVCYRVGNISRLTLLVLTAWVLVGLAGCGVRQLTQGELEAPKVKFQSLAVGLPTGQGLPLDCTLLVENPNPQDLKVLGYDYELQLEGRRVIQGESREAVTLPARGQTLVTVPILLKLKALPVVLPAVLKEQPINYRISGGVRLASLLGGFRVPFQASGRMTPKEGMGQLRLFMK
ncbi:MAG: LEA type 2 family protein [Thermodesulfobacteriota bacterium]